MALILLIETATPVCSIALAKNGKVISFREKDEPNIHASQITLFIEEVIKEAGVAFSDLNAVAVSKGPGSYTGLRIGVSTAKGLCYALDIPLIAVNTLEALASGYKESLGVNSNTFLCPMIDARRMEVYMAVFDSELQTVEPTQARILDEHSFDDYPNIVLFGNGAAKTESLYAHKKNIHIASLKSAAQYLVSYAFRNFNNGIFEDVAYFEPFYLKEFVAGKPKQA